MLKKRLITAAFLIPIFVVLLLKLSSLQFGVLTAAFVLIGAWEWSALIGLKRVAARIVYLVFIFFLLQASLYLYIPMTLEIAFVWWLFATALIFLYPKGSAFWGKAILLQGLMGVLVLIPAWVAINFIRMPANEGPDVLLFLCVLIWGADSGAYFAGKKWGKNKLAPNVSPGKTREGLYGALLTTVLIAFVGLSLQNPPLMYWVAGFFLAMITVIFSVIGDLFESMLKRNVGLKDSGRLFPGHGGLLDRIDSLTAAAPVFALGGWLISRYL